MSGRTVRLRTLVRETDKERKTVLKKAMNRQMGRDDQATAQMMTLWTSTLRVQAVPAPVLTLPLLLLCELAGLAGDDQEDDHEDAAAEEAKEEPELRAIARET